MKKMFATLLALAAVMAPCVAYAGSEPKTTDSIDDKTVCTDYINENEFPYTYTDAAGREITITEPIKKIAVDYLPLWETMTLLGVEPIAVSGSDNYLKTWDAFEGYEFDEITDISNGSEINLELLAELEPDLILTQAWDVNDLDIGNYEKLANVAVFDNTTKMDWRASLREIGALLGLENRAENVIAEVEERLKDAKETLVAKLGDQTVMQVSVMSEDGYYCAWREDLYGEDGLNLKTPEGYPKETTYQQVSMEAIAEMNPDYLFLNVFDGDDALYDAMTSTSVWQSLTAVKNNHVYVLDGGGHATSALSTLYTINFMIDALNQA